MSWWVVINFALLMLSVVWVTRSSYLLVRDWAFYDLMTLVVGIVMMGIMIYTTVFAYRDSKRHSYSSVKEREN